MLSTLLAKPTARPALGARQPLRRKSVVVRADNKPLREFSEETGEVTSGGKPAADSGQKQEALYAEENYVVSRGEGRCNVRCWE